MNHKFILFGVFFFLTTTVSADELKRDSADTVFDYMTCSTFFAVLATTMGGNKNSAARFNQMSERMLDHAISLESDGYEGVDEDEVAKKLQAEMQKSEDSAKKVVRLYAPHCKKLLQEITTRKSVPKR